MVELFETKVWETSGSPFNPWPSAFWHGTYVLPRNGEIESSRIPITKCRKNTWVMRSNPRLLHVKRYLPKKGSEDVIHQAFLLISCQISLPRHTERWWRLSQQLMYRVGDLGGMTRIATAPPLWLMALMGSIRIVVTQDKCLFSCLFSWRVSHWQFATSSLGTTLCQLRSWWNCGWALPVDSQA